ncbi:MAG: transposase [Methyloprofundus sp.]|nr:transposase [Methyloprofundus sp.]
MQYRRFYQPGARYFFTVVTASRKPLLIDHIERLRAAFKQCIARYPFEIEAMVVLPDHLHTIWRLPEGDADFSKRWMVIKRNFSSGLLQGTLSASKLKKREKGIWQRRFWEHCIRNEDDWRKHMDYIHFNPVKHGYTEMPGDWQYSSYQKAVDKGWYEPNVPIKDDFKGIGHE